MTAVPDAGAPILGVHVGHDAAAALIVDGRVAYVEEEERHVREKGFVGAPFAAAAAALAACGLRSRDVAVVAIGWDLQRYAAARRILAIRASALGNSAWAKRRLGQLARAERQVAEIKAAYPDAAFVQVPHHVAHAASVVPFLEAPSGDTATVVLDAFGDDVSASVLLNGFHGTAEGPTWPLHASLGYFYQRWAEHLGFSGREACGYLMALAAHGDRRTFGPALRRAATDRSPHGLPWISHEAFDPLRGFGSTAGLCFSSRIMDSITPVRDEAFAWRADVAAAIQDVLEHVVLELCAWIAGRGSHARLSVAGGVFMNCTLVGRLQREGIFREVVTGPASHDAGTALGAAVVAQYWRGGTIARAASAFLGSEATSGIGDLDAVLPKNMSLAHVSQPAKAVVDDLVAGKTVAIASGRLEFGPRALGARSILALPAAPAQRDRLNAIKQRHTFQPVAASVLAESVSSFFAVTQPARFMAMSALASARAVAELPAAVHADQTCRVHVPLAGDAPFLQSVLQELHRRGLPPAVLNTSFNARGQPLPRVAADIVVMYLGMDVDVLYLDDRRLEVTNPYRNRTPGDESPPDLIRQWAKHRSPTVGEH